VGYVPSEEVCVVDEATAVGIFIEVFDSRITLRSLVLRPHSVRGSRADRA